jgi:transcriptional regulator with XRE-family HTH domain
VTGSREIGETIGYQLRRLRRLRGLTQEELADRANVSRDLVGKLEQGRRQTARITSLVSLACALDVELSALVARRSDRRPSDGPVIRERATTMTPASGLVKGEQRYPEIDDINRRELLRLLAIAGASLATLGAGVDWDRLDHAARAAYLDAATADEYAALNAQLWHIFAASRTKSVTFPVVNSQLGVLINAFPQVNGSAMRQRLCSLIADLLQLAGEILFDANRYTDATHCYTLAATASKEAEAFDLWACAMTRHAFVGVYERQFDKALPMLLLAADLARNGDSTLSTRHWVSTVQAHAFAGLGEVDACEKALDYAEHIHQLTGQVHTGGWLRFDGSRLAEERGTCYVELHRPHLAEAALNEALRQDLSPRRRGSVLTDLAVTGAQCRDPDRILTYASTALDTARRTGSGVIGRKLQDLQTYLTPFLSDSRIRQLNTEITDQISASDHLNQ